VQISYTGYDHAYFELSQLLLSIGEKSPATLIAVLSGVEPSQLNIQTPNGTAWVMKFLENFRLGLTDWVNSDISISSREGAINRQFLLARVAAGINWADKPISDQLKKMSLVYAGWAANEYIDRYESHTIGVTLSSVNEIESQISEESNETKDKLWLSLYNKLNKFHPENTRFILIAERLICE